MFEYLNINKEIVDYIDYESELETYNNLINGGATQRERYFYKILDKSDFDITNSILGIQGSYKYKLNSLNPLLPNLTNKEQENILFLQSDNIKDYNIGFTIVGKYREDINSTKEFNDKKISKAPDTIDIFLSKKNSDGTVTAWKRLTDEFPGLNKIYKGRESTKYITKNMYVSGKNQYDKGMGDTITSTNSYNITTTIRVLLSKEETSKKINDLIKRINENDFSVMDFKPLYKSSDSYHTKLNTLANGNLENLVFESSGIKDTDIKSTTTSVGERFLLKKKMNVEVFLDSMNQFKNESTQNRMDFNAYFKKLNENISEKDLEKIKKDPIKDFKNTLIKFTKESFDKNINPIQEYKKALKNFAEKYPNKKIKIGNFLKYAKDSEDYLGQNKILKEELIKKFLKDKNKNIYDMYVEVGDISKILENIEKDYKPYINRIKIEMSKVIHDRAKIVDFGKYDYLYKMSGNNLNNDGIEFDIIKRQITSDFFNAYNEKFDLFEMLINRRKRYYISDIEKTASLVSPIFKNGKKIGYDYKKRREYINDLVNVSESDLELRYGLYKARNKIGQNKFDKLSFKEQEDEAIKFLNNNKKLVEKAKTKTILGKYDTVENFEKTRQALKNNSEHNDNAYMELLSGDMLATTQDKVISNLNKDKSLEVSLATFEKINDNKSAMLKFYINFNKKDGFEGNDLIKNILAVNVGELRDSSYSNQRFIQDRLDLIKKNISTQNIIKEAVRKEFIDGEMARNMLSYLKGNSGSNKTFFGIDKNDNLVYIRDTQDYKQKGIKKITDYSTVYNKIIETLIKKNMTQAIPYKSKTMKSVSRLFNEAYEKDKNITNSLFMNLLNRDDIVNFSGGGIQSSFIKGNSNLVNLGYTSPGIAFNKMTQRTFQSKDLLGEKTIMVNGEEKSISLINAEILSKLDVGISIRKGKYKTEELLKETTNLMREKYGINNKKYIRGEVFKTFAIGDFNTEISKDYSLDSFTSSFQEGMTSSMALKNTTNAIRTKLININLDEINYDKLGISRIDFESILLKKDNIEEAASKILNKDLFETIEGNKKLSSFYEDLDKMNKRINSNNFNSNNFYSKLIDIANKYITDRKQKFKKIKDISKDDAELEIMNILEDIKFKIGAVSKPTTSEGKNIITRKDIVNKTIEIKPEVGFSISNLSYNKQEKNIEILLENTASSDPGSKNQAIGAKFTVSAVYDKLFLKDNNNKKYAIAGIFNNKTEKRAQTGMYIHGTLQTMFSNVYDKMGLKGVEKLSKNIKDLLKDLQVEVTIDEKNDSYYIDEMYLTRDFKGKEITAEEFEELLLNEGLGNSNKMFTDRGKEIIDKVSKKYGASYLNKNGEFEEKSLSHLGVVLEANRGYLKTFKDLGKEVTPFVFDQAEGIATYNGKTTSLGKGPVLLMKMTTERVNSNASKKKESASKIGKEMMYMMKIGGYSKLVDFMKNKQKDKVVKTLNDTFNIINLNSYINQIYHREGEVDVNKLSNSLANNLDNSIILKVSEITNDDYLLNSEDVFLKHFKLMDSSILGKKLKEKGLDILNSDNNRLKENVNVIIQDDTIEEFYSELKSSINNVINSLDDKKDSVLKNNLNYFIESNKIDYKNINNLINQKNNIERFLNRIQNKTLKKDSEYIRRFVNILENNKDDKFALSTLQTIIKTGKMISVVNLNYDIHETDGTIVNSPELKKIINISKNNNNYTSISYDALNVMKKLDNNDTSIIDDIINGVSRNLDNYSNENDDIYTRIFSQIDDEYLSQKHSDVSELINDIKTFHNDINMYNAEKNAVNNMLETYGKNLIETPEEIKNFIQEKEFYFDEATKELNIRKKSLVNSLNNKNTRTILSGRLNNLLFGDYKNSSKTNRTIMNNIRNIIVNEGREQVNTMFSSLNEYLTMPDEIQRFTKKGSSIYESMKYKVKTSFVANPIEGSGLLEQFKQITFENVKDIKTLKSNLNELEMLLTNKIVNKNLFIDNGVDYFKELENIKGDSKAFAEGLEKAKKVFGKNLSGINGITIMDSSFTKAFRNKDYLPKDLFENSLDGITREMVFFSRYPQQTAQHFGSIMAIGIDRNVKINNKYVEAVLPFLSQEKNQAGIITLGKKTMLTVRGDHDGDKVQIAFTDFLDKDIELKQSTINQMYMDFQLRNNKLTRFVEVDDATKRIKNINGSLFEFNDPNSMENSILKLNDKSLEESYEILNDKLGINKTDVAMKYKYFDDLDFRIGMRAFKELGKHNNSSYELLAKLNDVVPFYKNYSLEDLKNIKTVLDKFNSEVDRNSKYTGRHLRNADNVIEFLTEINKRKFSVKEQIELANKIFIKNDNLKKIKSKEELDELLKSSIYKMDTISSTVFFTHFKTNPKNSDELYKNTLKEIKNIDRGSFSKLTTKTAKSIYEELSGIKNTGKTFDYASRIRNTSTELSDINPTVLLSNLGEFATSNLSIEELENLKNMQKYFGYGIDSTVDNMIESAISAKHGLTLGGLEGTKIFTNLLLSPNSEKLNDNIIKLFNDYVTNDNISTKINTIEKLAKFSKTVSTINASFEDAYAEVDKLGLDKSVFQLVINNKKALKSRYISDKDSKLYSEIRNKFLGENFNIEIELAKSFKTNNKLNNIEYQTFEGLSRIGDMLTQNEPGTEFDPDEVLNLINKFKTKEISAEDFFREHEIKLINSQLFSSLGSAAAISSIGKTRNYAKAFVNKTAFEKAVNYIRENIKENSSINLTNKELNYIIKKLDILSSKTKDEELYKKINEITNEEMKLTILEEDFEILKDSIKIKDDYYMSKFNKSISDPTAYFTEVFNASNSIFSNSKKDKSIVSDILDNLYKGTGYSLNPENLFDTSLKQSVQDSSLFGKKIIGDYFNEKVDFIEDIFVDETQSRIFRQNLNNIIDDILYKQNKKNIKLISYYDFIKDSNMVGAFIKRELNDNDKKLFDNNRLIQIKQDNVDDFFKNLSNSRKYYLDDVLFLYDKGRINFERLNKLKQLYKQDNIFISDKLLRKMHELDNDFLKNEFYTNAQITILKKDMINAYKYFGENVTEANVLKRMKKPFDHKLATKIYIDNFLKKSSYFLDGTSTENKKTYLRRLEKNVNNLLMDFNKIYKINNNYDINETFFKLANILTEREKDYRTLYNYENSKAFNNKLKKNIEYINDFINKNIEIFDEIDIDKDAFTRYSLLSLMNNGIKNIVNDSNYTLKEELKTVINNDDLYSNIEKNIVSPNIKGIRNKKLSLGLILGTAGALLGKKVLQYLTNADNNYIVSKGNNRLTEEQILNNLNIGNGQSSEMITQELLNSKDVPNYINIVKKYF